jgi:lipopolysaccharide export system protein LptC
MSEAASPKRRAARSWAAPGGFHDWLVKGMKILLPAAVGALLAYLLLSPLSRQKEISFLLDKKKVDVAGERLKVEAAQYRGLDNQGRPFTLTADKALQATSAEPVVGISGMSANILLDEGPASIRADNGRYDMDKQKVAVDGPIHVRAADGYTLETRDVTVDFNTKRLQSGGRVEGKMPLGRFSAGRMTADLPTRTVVLAGRAQIHIVQGGLKK